MTFAVSESSTDQYQRGDGGADVEVMVGSGIEVVVTVAVFFTDCGVDVDATGLSGSGLDTVGAPQAKIKITNVNNGGMILFMFPLSTDKKKGGVSRPYFYMSLRGGR